ncbi:MAG: hypothetical protein ACFCVA_00360 [Gammaproteobacteria bacterium]
MARLRRKLGQAGQAIETIRGVGYQLSSEGSGPDWTDVNTSRPAPQGKPVLLAHPVEPR